MIEKKEIMSVYGKRGEESSKLVFCSGVKKVDLLVIVTTTDPVILCVNHSFERTINISPPPFYVTLLKRVPSSTA